MDILNFISWIKGRIISTIVDPDTSLLPLGVKTNKRDDNFLTVGISVKDFSNNLGVGIEIPKLIAKTVDGNIVFSLDFYQSDAWKALNPRIFLYRLRKKKRIFKSGNPTIIKSVGFVHPTNTAGAQPGGRWWTGEQKIMPYLGGSAPDPLIRHTEFPLLSTVPYESFNLPDLSPYEWVQYKDLTTNTYRQSTAADFPVPDTNAGADPIGNFYVKFFQAKVAPMFPINQRDMGSGSMRTTFRFAIVIDNPNATSEAPYLIGSMSNNVDLKFITNTATNMVNLFFTTAYTNKITGKS